MPTLTQDLGAQYYSDNYVDYRLQNPPHKLAYYQKLITPFSKGEGTRVYDIGCGLGSFLFSLNKDWHCYGSDINSFAVAQARQKIPNGTFRVGSFGSNLFGEMKFDLVTAWDVLEHVENLEEAYNEVSSLLVPGGVFTFVVPVYDGLSGPLVRRLDKDPTHVHKEGRRFWLETCSEKFRVLNWEGVLRYLLPNGTYLHLPTKKFRFHTPAISLVCRKR